MAEEKTVSPELALALRLDQVSHAIYGDTRPSRSSGTAIMPRVAAVMRGLQAVERDNKPVRQFIESWDDNADLLHPHPHTTSTAGEEWDELTKVHHLLAMYPEIIAAADDLAKIDTLVHQRHVLDGSKQLQRALTASKPALQQLQQSRDSSFETTQQKLMAFITRYNDFTTTMSQIFLALDEQVCALEDQTRKLARSQP